MEDSKVVSTLVSYKRVFKYVHFEIKILIL